jgi:hypothetical protein
VTLPDHLRNGEVSLPHSRQQWSSTYVNGMTSRQVATPLGLGRATALDILKAAGVALRLVGVGTEPP